MVLAVLLVGMLAGALAWLLLRSRPAADAGAPRLAEQQVDRLVAERPRTRHWLRAGLDPARTTEVAMVSALAVVVAAALAIGVLIIMIRTHTGLAWWDSAAARWGARNATNTSTRALKTFTQLGGTATVVVLGLVAAAVETWRTRSRAVFGYLVVVFVGVSLIVNVTKWLVDRARPDLDRLVGFSGASFPSGHAATAAAFYASLALLLGRGRTKPVRRALSAAAVGIAAAVAATRVLLGVHWFTDVLAGLLIGWAWYACCTIAFGGRRLHFGEPVEVAQEVATAGQPSVPDRA